MLYPPLNKSNVLRAERGDTQAQCGLGRLYRDIIKDYPQAVKWFRMAAEQWDPQGQVSLGDCYLSGRGLTQDAREAEKWFRAAAEQGGWTGQQRLGEFYARRRDEHPGDEEAPSLCEQIAGLISREQASEAERRAAEWKCRSEEDMLAV